MARRLPQGPSRGHLGDQGPSIAGGVVAAIGRAVVDRAADRLRGGAWLSGRRSRRRASRQPRRRERRWWPFRDRSREPAGGFRRASGEAGSVRRRRGGWRPGGWSWPLEERDLRPIRLCSSTAFIFRTSTAGAALIRLTKTLPASPIGAASTAVGRFFERKAGGQRARNPGALRPSSRRDSYFLRAARATAACDVA